MESENFIYTDGRVVKKTTPEEKQVIIDLLTGLLGREPLPEDYRPLVCAYDERVPDGQLVYYQNVLVGALYYEPFRFVATSSPAPP